MKINMIAIMLLAGTALWAQSESRLPDGVESVMPESDERSTSAQSAPSPRQEDSESQGSYSGIEVPAEITAQTHYQGSGAGSQERGMNYISGGLGLGFAYDDNAWNSRVRRLSELQYEIAPEIGLHSKGSRSTFDLAYRSGLTLSREAQSRDEVLHNLSTNLSYALSRHVDLNFRNTFIRQSSTVASGFGDANSAPSLNQFVFTPMATRNSVDLGGDLGWHFGPHSITGISGEYSRLRFSQVVAGQTLTGVNSAEIQAYLGQQLSARHSIGAAAKFQYLSNAKASGENTHVAGLLLFDVFRLTDKIQLSLYGGPQLPRMHALAPSDARNLNKPFVAEGAALQWQRSRLRLVMSFDNTISDGGGIAQAVRLRSGAATAKLKLSRAWDFGISCNAGDNEVLGGTTSFRTLAGGLSLQRQLTSGLRLEARYEHIYQTYGYATGGVDRNGLQVMIWYRFIHPLGIVATER